MKIIKKVKEKLTKNVAPDYKTYGNILGQARFKGKSFKFMESAIPKQDPLGTRYWGLSTINKRMEVNEKNKVYLSTLYVI